MTPLRALVVFLWLAILSAGSYMWTKHTAADPIAITYPRVDTTSVLDEVAKSTVKSDAVRSEGPWDVHRTVPRVDLNGNEIDDAVGDYRVDGRGELYERHAPDTALPHLGSARL
jgi:hypothetical protein